MYQAQAHLEVKYKNIFSVIKNKLDNLEERYRRSEDENEKELIKKEERKIYTVAVALVMIKERIKKGKSVSADTVERLKAVMPEVSKELALITGQLPKGAVNVDLLKKAWDVAGVVVNIPDEEETDDDEWDDYDDDEEEDEW